MARKKAANSPVSPDPRDFKGLTPEERVRIMVEMTDAVGAITLESLRYSYPRISEGKLLEMARRRFQSGRGTR